MKILSIKETVENGNKIVCMQDMTILSQKNYLLDFFAGQSAGGNEKV